MIREGDICLCVPEGLVGRAISWWTGSPFSHAQLVTCAQEGADPRSTTVLEVGWVIREATIAALGQREFVALRPTRDDDSAVPEDLGRRVAANTMRLVRSLRSIGYPWWKIPAYILPRFVRQRLIIGGPRQVCSVFAIRPWVSHGLPFFFYGAERERVDEPDEIRSVTPADIAKNAVERKWEVVHRTSHAPPLS